jgi:hypothetical protein
MGPDSVWGYDHFFSNTPDEPPRMPVHESWTIVSAVAARTSRVEIGQLVMCTAYRPPALLAKMAATADAVSGGRITLELGGRVALRGVPGLRLSLRPPLRAVRGDAPHHLAARPRRHRHLRRHLSPIGRGRADAAGTFDSHPDCGVSTAHAPTHRAPCRRLEHGVVRDADDRLRRAFADWTPRSTRRAEIPKRSAKPRGSIRGGRRRTRARVACSSTTCPSSSRRTRRSASTMSS